MGCVARPDGEPVLDGPVAERDGAGSEAGPEAILVAPVGLAPVNLAAVVVRFPDGAPASLEVEGVDGVSRPGTPGDPICGGADWTTCAIVDLTEPLEPGRTYEVAGLSFTAGEDWDLEPPAAAASATTSDGCVVVRVAAGEPVFAAMTVEDATVTDGNLATEHELAHVWGAAGGWFTPAIRLVDQAGHEVTLDTAPVAASPAPGFAISEVLANAAGDEPDQEWIELVRTADTPASLAGLRISDGAASDVLPDLVVEPGARVLVVPAAFAGGGADVAPWPGTPLARLDGPIGLGGLANAGEPVLLLDESGAVLSAFAAVEVTGSAWNGRSVERRRVRGCDARANRAPNALGAATPGAPNSVETP